MRYIVTTVFLFLMSGILKAQVPTGEVFVIPANKAYAEPFKENNRGVRIPVGYPESKGEVSRWTDKSTSVAWIVYQQKGSYDLSFENTVNKGAALSFSLQVTATDKSVHFKPVTKAVKFKGTGEKDTLRAVHLDIKETGYYKYLLTPVSDPQNIIRIASLQFRSLQPGGHVNFINYQSSPSVHLSFSTTEKDIQPSYNWLYEEILVPEGMDPLYTYYEAIGFYRGYMGIQTNSPTERRVLFSVWDSKDAEHDKSINKGDLVTLVDRDTATTVNNFGGEGTGGQSYVKGANWKTGKPVKFLMNVLPRPDSSALISAWYQVDNEGWKYIATWRAPKEQRYFNGFYSFIENYGYTNGQVRREAYYYNAWGFNTVAQRWVHLNKVRFSNTDGKEGQRVDFEQGVAPKYPDRFYMSSGGYTGTIKRANEVPLSHIPPAIELKQFEARVQQAIQNGGKYNIKSAVQE